MSTARSACLLGVLILSSASCEGSSSETDAVTGRILEGDGAPAVNAIVYIGERSFRTDAAGRFFAGGVTTP